MAGFFDRNRKKKSHKETYFNTISGIFKTLSMNTKAGRSLWKAKRARTVFRRRSADCGTVTR